MKRSMMVVLTTLFLMVSAHAAAPGPLDGQDIPTDFAASKLIGVQTNRTGVGDVTDLALVANYSRGTELGALYMARDSSFLYIGIAGNLLEVGNPFIILINNPFDEGQIELRTEGVGGPPFALQMAGREVVIDTNGTTNGMDDTHVATPNSGAMLPTCGNPSFNGWNYALAIDGAGGNLFAHEYLLFSTNGGPIGTASAADTCNYGDGRGRVPCDPTPDNPGDSLSLYAQRTLVSQGTIGDGDEFLEDSPVAINMTRGGFFNANTTGVTDTTATLASITTTGVEIAIPLGRMSLFGDETIDILVLTMEVDEFEEYPISGPFGTVLNQALPSLSGSSCSTPTSLGLRPNLSSIATCLTVDLNTLGAVDLGAFLDGNIKASDYGLAGPILTQQCPTSGGDQVRLSDTLQPVQDGSELDQLFVDHDDDFLYLGLTGNLQGDGSSINMFIDVDSNATNGDQLISDFSNFALDGAYGEWTSNGVLTSGTNGYRVQSTDAGGGFSDINPNINAAGATTLELDVFIDPSPANHQADGIRVVLTDADGTELFYDFDITGLTGAQSLSLSLDDFAAVNMAGAVPGLDLADLSFFHIAGGFNNGVPGLPFDVTFDRLALSDTDNGQHVLDFAPASAFEETVISDFGNFNLLGTYVSWNTATFTSGANDFRVVATGGFGGGFADINPNVDIRGALSLQLDVTINPASSGGGSEILVVLADGDDTQLRYGFPGLTPGTHTITVPYSSGVPVFAGGDGVFDASNISFFHIQCSFDVTDIVFDNLQVIKGVAGASAIATLTGDELPNNPLDVLGNGSFLANASVHYDYAYGIFVSYKAQLAYIDHFNLINESFTFRGAVVPDSGSSALFDDPGGMTASNPNNLELSFNNTNTSGVVGCPDQDPCFLEDAQTVGMLAAQATSGVEMAIPLADLGLSAGDLPRVIRLWTMIGGPSGFASDQSLPSMRNQSNGGNQVFVPGNAPINFTAPEGGPSFSADLSDFSNLVLDGTYARWSDMSAIITSGPNDLRIQSFDWGGGFFFLNPFVDATGASSLRLDVTLNPANAANALSVVLFDGDGTIRLYNFPNLTNGAHTLTKNLNDFTRQDAIGAVPGLDVGNIGQVNLEGGFNHGDPGSVLDVTFDNLSLIGEERNYEARAARICLGTIDGDGDCDGDNDLRDYWLMQQCVGVSPNPVLPMECEQLDLFKDGQIDNQDMSGFSAVVTGP